MNCRKKNEKIQYFWGNEKVQKKEWLQSEMGKGKVMHDRVWNRTHYFEFAAILNEELLEWGNSNENK